MLRHLAFAALLSGAAGPVLAATTPSFVESFDTFSSSASGSTGTWMTTYPYGPPATRTLPGNHEAECYVDPTVGYNPFSDANGILTMRAWPLKSGQSNVCGLPYNSGLITTFHSFSQLYGTFVMRAKLPAGQGLWPAWWFLPASNQYTAELDAFEVLGNDPTTLYFTTHGADASGQWTVDSQALKVPDLSAGSHTYRMTWGPKQVVLSLDGTQIASAPTPASMNTPMYMLINLAVGGSGSWPGPPNASTSFPAEMKIDWVRAYTLP